MTVPTPGAPLPMADIPRSQVITAVSTLVARLGSTYLANRFNRDRHKKDRTWEKRAEAMGKILHAIHRACLTFRNVKSYYDEDPIRAHSSDEVAALERKAYEEVRKAESVYRSSFLFLSRAFIASYTKYRDSLEAMNEDLSPPEVTDAMLEQLEAAAEDLSKQAQSDVAERYHTCHEAGDRG